MWLRLGRCANIITGEDSSLPRVKPFKYAYEKEIVLYAYYKKLDYFSTECIYAPFAARGFAREFIKDLEVRGPITWSHGATRRRMQQGCRVGNCLALSRVVTACAHKLCVKLTGLSHTCVSRNPSCGQAARPLAIIDVIRSAEDFVFAAASDEKLPQPRTCERCGYISSQPVCKACVLLEGLNRGMPRLGVSRTRGRRGEKAGLHPDVGRGGGGGSSGPAEVASESAEAASTMPAERQGGGVAQAPAGGEGGAAPTTAGCADDGLPRFEAWASGAAGAGGQTAAEKVARAAVRQRGPVEIVYETT